MLRKIRIISQIFFFTLFIATFFLINVPPHPYAIHSDLFLRINPLVGLLTSIAARTFIWAVVVPGLIVAALTVVFGRVFCGFICPLGAAIDFSDTHLFKKSRSGHRRPPQYLHRLKYVLLIALFVLAIFGAVFPLFMDPISLITRICAIIVNPLLKLAGAAAIASGAPVLEHVGLEKLRFATLATPVFYGIPFMLLLSVAIFGATFWDKRFWCQYVCPSGALFGLLSRFPLFMRVTKTETCTSCAACARVCPTRAIAAAHFQRTSTAECVVCGACTDIKESCSEFRFARPVAARIPGPILNRRHLLQGAVSGVLLVPLFNATAAKVTDGSGKLIRPPGAIPEPDFLSRCIACGNCMKACPTNTLQPCLLSEGFNRLYTPRLVPRVGGCDSKCHLCGYVCPTGAIRKLPLEEKPYAKLGTAVIDRSRCLAWEQNKECVVCDEVCPYNAIEPRLVETTKGQFTVPVVNEDLCMGCGMCEMQCPIFDRAAIEVFRFGEKRLAMGSYATVGQKRKIDRLRQKSGADALSETGNKTPDGAPAVPPKVGE